MLLLLLITVLLGAAGFLLALASDGFGYVLSRVVEPAFDFVEYRLALRDQRRQKETNPREKRFAGRTAYSHAA